MIILEGPDNSGKSTLAAQLSKKIKWDVEHSQRLQRPMSSIAHSTIQLRNRPIIQDRVYALSEYVYSRALKREPDIDLKSVMLDFMARHYLVIFCRPSNVAILANNGREQMEGVVGNHMQIIREYDFLRNEMTRFSNSTVITYDYETMNPDMLIEKVQKYVDSHNEKVQSIFFSLGRSLPHA